MLRFSLAVLSALLSLILFADVAFAGVDLSQYAPREDEPLDVWLKRALFGSAVAAIAYAWTWLKGKKAVQKVQQHIDVHRLIQMVAGEAIGYAEEVAHRAIKAGKKLESEVKEHEAVQRGLELLKKYGFDTKKAREAAEDEMRKIIRARLGATRTKTSAGA